MLCTAGVMVLSKDHPQLIYYRSEEPVLKTGTKTRTSGHYFKCSIPTGIDRRDDLGLPDRFDVYYGMADDRIGVARLDLPEYFTNEGIADKTDAKV